MTISLRDRSTINGYLGFLGLSVLCIVMSVLMGLPSDGMHEFLNGVFGIELTIQQFAFFWIITEAFLIFTFLVTEMFHVDRKWIDWPRWAQIHTLLVAASAYGVFLQGFKLFVPFWDKICGA